MKSIRFIVFVFLSLQCFNVALGQEYYDTICWVWVNDPSYYAVDGDQFSSNKELNSLFAQKGVVYYEQAYPFAKTHELHKIHEIRCSYGYDINEVIYALVKNFGTSVFDNYHRIEIANYEEIAEYDPVDYMWTFNNGDWLWHLKKIKADSAWNITQGDTAVKTAVIDLAIDITHPDLISEISPSYDPYTGNQLSTYGNHGTAVASFVSAETTCQGEIAQGQLASVGFKTKMIAYESCGRELFLQKALHASTIMGADVIVSCAGGALGCVPIPSTGEEMVMKEILNNGTVIVTSAGNGVTHRSVCGTYNNYTEHYPFNSSYDERVIVVTSTDTADCHRYVTDGVEHTHSHFPTIDICAPGYEVMGAKSKRDTVVWPYYGKWTGTSFSAPIVAGACSLIKSINRDFTPGEIQYFIKSTADPVQDEYLFHGMLGAGRLNVYKAVQKAYNCSPVLITSNETWDDDKIIVCGIEILQGACLTINSTIKLSKHSSIIVHPGGKLIVDGGLLTSLDDIQWPGIQVWGNSSAPQTATNGVYQQGYVELENDATIENAVCALDLWKPNDYTKTGGIVVATDANFINNAQSVRALHYIYTNGNNTEVNYNAHFTRCNFEVNDDYLGTETFYKHVGLNTVKGVEFRGCSFSVDRTASNIATYCLGIGAEDASFTVTSHCNVPNTSPCPNGSLSVGTFTGFYNAIYAIYTYTQRPFYVLDCEFNDNINGIYAINTGFAQILGNTFYVPSESICTFGVYLEGMSSFVVGSNDFIGVGSGCENCGVGVKNSPYDNIIEQNSFSNFAFGTESIGKNYNAIMVRPIRYVTLNYSCNNNSSNVLADFYAINDESNIIGGVYNQGSSLQSAGNTFTSNCMQQIANLTTHTFTYYYDTLYSGRKPTSTYGVNLVKTNNANDCGMGGGGSSSKSPLTDYEDAESNCNRIIAALEAENDPNNIEVLEAELAQAEHQRLTIVGNAVRNILMDSISDINEARLWLGRANTPDADRAICATYFSQGDYETALNKAVAMIDKYEMEDDALIEQTEYISILKLQRKVETEGRVMEQLNGEELGQVQRLAENGTGVARSMAKAIMMMNGMAEAECDCNNELAETTRGNEGTKADAITENAEDDVYYFNISPVPAKDYIVIDYTMPCDNATVGITNNLGVTIKTIKVNGRSGKKVVSLSGITTGVYSCTIQGEGFVKTEKIVITK